MAERSWGGFKKDAQKFDQAPASPGRPSWLWYLLAIFLGIIGGLIGYFVLRRRDNEFAKRVLIVSIVATVLGSLFDLYVTIPYFFGAALP